MTGFLLMLDGLCLCQLTLHLGKRACACPLLVPHAPVPSVISAFVSHFKSYFVVSLGCTAGY